MSQHPRPGSRSRRSVSSVWTLAGDPDPDLDDAARATHQMLLTDPNLLFCYRRTYPDHAGADYDEMVRALGHVWDCVADGTANVTGYCCATCGRRRADAAADMPVRVRDVSGS